MIAVSIRFYKSWQYIEFIYGFRFSGARTGGVSPAGETFRAMVARKGTARRTCSSCASGARSRKALALAVTTSGRSGAYEARVDTRARTTIRAYEARKH